MQETNSLDNHKNEWTEQKIHLLKKWMDKAAGYRWLHNHARMRLRKDYDNLTYPTIILSSLTGVGGFAVLNPDSSSDARTSPHILYIQYLFALFNVITGILNAILKFNNSLHNSEVHSNMCLQYSKFYRNIDMELSLEEEHRYDATKFIKKCREEFDRLMTESPDIPSQSVTEFNRLFPNRENPPDVCNGLNMMTCVEYNLENKNSSLWKKAYNHINKVTSYQSNSSETNKKSNSSETNKKSDSSETKSSNYLEIV